MRMKRIVVSLFIAWTFCACVESEFDQDEQPADSEIDEKSDSAARQNNCAGFWNGWIAPPWCDCRGPNGETTYVDVQGKTQQITCDSLSLQACPNSSGVGCYLLGVGQTSTPTPGVSKVHVDIGGTLHDLCCAANYGTPGASGFSNSCNGCTGADPGGSEKCQGTTLAGSAIGLPYNPTHACAVEWNYATLAPFATKTRWFTEFDTQTRWTPAQVIRRGLLGQAGSYQRPGNSGGGQPLFGLALAPNSRDSVDHRAPSGTVLGPSWLTAPYQQDTKFLGLTPSQVASFCKSGKAEKRSLALQEHWRCL
jgi:hypothetical protein